MYSIAPHDSGVQHPPWYTKLRERGFSAATIAHFGLTGAHNGWTYPVAPHSDTLRWKAFPGQRGAKYRWQPRKPDGLTFYDPHGTLAKRIAAADGVLVLAAGEPDVWALHEGGILNATATMYGEGSLPPWLVGELQRLQVRTVRIWPDRDQAGLAHAIKLRDALAGSGVALEVFALPYPADSKADINTLLLDVGPGKLGELLAGCVPMALPERSEPRRERAAGPVSDTAATLYERWCHEVERAAIAAWEIAPPNAKNLSRRNFSSPFREDRRPSAQWNYATHGFTDYGAGEFYNTHVVADLLGMQPWQSYKADHLTELLPAEVPPELAEARCFPKGVPKPLVALLLNLHGDRWLNVRRGVLPNVGAAVATYVTWTELVRRGVLADDEPVTAVGLAGLSESGRRLSKDTAAKGLSQLHELELIEFLSLSMPQEVWVGTKSRLIESSEGENGTGRRGRRGYEYRLRPLAEAMPDLLRKLDAYLLSCVLVTEYPDAPVSAHALSERLRAFGLTDEHLDAIDEACAPLYADMQDERHAAMREYERRRAIFWTKYSLGALLEAEALGLRPDAETPNAAQFRNAVDDAYLDEKGGVRADRYAAARAVGRTLSSHRAACEGRDIITVPQYDDIPLAMDGDDVVSCCATLDPRAFERGSMELVAPNGSSVRVSAQYAGTFDYDDWVSGQDGAAPVVVRIQRPSIEMRRDLASPEQLAAYEAMSERQQTISRRRSRPKPTTAPPEPPTQWPADYLLRQGELRAHLFGIDGLMDGRFVTPDGEIIPRDAGVLWRAMAEVIDPPPAPPLPGTAPERPGAAGAGPVTRSGSGGQGAPDGDSPYDYVKSAEGHVCLVCGAPAARLHWSGWYCADHYDLPLDAKRRFW